MKNRTRALVCRRGFITTMSGLLSGIFLTRDKPLHARLHSEQNKQLLNNLEMDAIETSTPLRHPSITWKIEGDKILLYGKIARKTHPLCIMNDVGKTIWESCNGMNTPKDISKVVCKRYLVSPLRAYNDSLLFLAKLKKVNAIQI